MPPIPDWGHQARLGQLGEMRARGLRRDPSREGKLAGGQGAAIEKRRKHRSSRRFPDQRRDLGDERACNHLFCITPNPADRLEETVRPRSNSRAFAPAGLRDSLSWALDVYDGGRDTADIDRRKK
jgi:hypothetical protein